MVCANWLTGASLVFYCMKFFNLKSKSFNLVKFISYPQILCVYVHDLLMHADFLMFNIDIILPNDVSIFRRGSRHIEVSVERQIMEYL